MAMPGRNYNAESVFRYGFNGKERDLETTGTTTYDYGFRIYSPALGKFLSVDPLTQSYPWYTPYQFAGNSPILFIDRDGKEPEFNKKFAGAAEMLGKMIVLKIIDKVADAYHGNEAPIWFWPVKAPEIKGKYSCGGIGDAFITDTKEEMALKLNMFVSTASKFNVDESNAGDYKNYEGAVTFALVKSFITGEGPQNYVFPKNGIVSSKFLKSDVLKQALTEFLVQPDLDFGPKQSEFGLTELSKDYLRNGSILSSITGMVGSASISIKKVEKGVEINIFNITSLTSGTFGKEALKLLEKIGIDYTNFYPTSYVRDPDKKTPYSNISQTFGLFIPFNTDGDKFKNIKDVISKGEYNEK